MNFIIFLSLIVSIKKCHSNSPLKKPVSPWSEVSSTQQKESSRNYVFKRRALPAIVKRRTVIGYKLKTYKDGKLLNMESNLVL